MPSYWYQGHMVTYKDTVLIVNGLTKTDPNEDSKASDLILQYVDGHWVEFPKKLPEARYNSVVFIANGDDLKRHCSKNGSMSNLLSNYLKHILFFLFILFS